MNVTYRKARKLFRNPKAFFYDSRIFNPRVRKGLAAQDKTESRGVVNKQLVDIYLSDSLRSSNKFISHLTKVLNGVANISIGNYRLKNTEMLFLCEGELFLVTLNHPVENETLIKGMFLIVAGEQIDNLNDNSQKINELIHKINVRHMKAVSDFYTLYYYLSSRQDSAEQELVKYALLAGIYNDKIIERALILLGEKFNSFTQQDAILLFRKVYRVLGTDGRLEKIADHFSATLKKNSYPIHFMMNLSAFFTESGSYDKALDVAHFARSKDKNAWFKHRYLGLTHLLVENNLLNEEWALKESNVFLELRRNEWDFEQYVRKNFNAICLVGNSPIELGKGKGNLIDNKEKVVRFNGAIIEHPYSLDYGAKTNILVINPRYYETQRNRKFDLDFIVVSDGNLYSSRNVFYKLHDLFQFADKICFIPRKLDLSLTQEIESSPSSGLKFISWLYSVCGPVDKNNIFGFSLNDQGHGIATSYSSGRRVGLNTIHDWDKERAYLDSMLEKKFNKSLEDFSANCLDMDID